MRSLALLALVVVAAVGCAGSDEPVLEVTGTIAFTRGEHVWLMNADGSAQRRLTRGDGPSWSPDGRQIAFDAERPPDRSEIHVVDPGGGRRLRLSTAQIYDAHHSAVWSPDGRTIAFQGYYDGSYWISVVNVDGTGGRTLTSPSRGRWEDADPAWSPDGRTIAFTNVHDNAVYVMRPDGSGRRVLLRAQDDGRACCAEWSPDGRRIAFVRDDLLWVLNADGTGLQMLADYSPFGIAWSPDGDRIAFRSGAIFVVNADGTGLRKLAGDLGDVVYDAGPVWSPDGRALAFTSERDGNAEIYVVDADGGDQRNISNSPGKDSEPAWSPTS